MEGRWTIRKWDGGSEVLGDHTVSYTHSGDVPVVPCDDAAVKRLAAMFERELFPNHPIAAHRMAQEALRAAAWGM